MKSFTDIKQSKKLAEILPIESADMYYEPSPGFNTQLSEVKIGNIKYAHPLSITCWNLAALINAMPKIQGDKAIIYLSDNDNYVSYTHIGINAQASSLVDACYEIIIKLHEQKFI